jgi:hypothetical protein
MIIKYQKRLNHENWMTVQTSYNNNPNVIEAMLDSLQRSYQNHQLRAITADGKILSIR